MVDQAWQPEQLTKQGIGDQDDKKEEYCHKRSHNRESKELCIKS